MPQTDTVTQAALAGLTAAPDKPNPHIWSSTHWEAFEVGRHCLLNGPSFHTVQVSRGSTYRLYRFGDSERHFLIHIIYARGGGHRVALREVQA